MEEKSELQLHAKCYQWFHNTYPEYRGLLFHVNGKAKNAIEGNKFRAMGVVPGVPDLLLIFKCSVIGLELKKSTGVLSKEQLNVHAKWEKQGIKVHVVRSFSEFQEIVKSVIAS